MFGMVIIITLLTGCGATFVRKDLSPELAQTKKYGVLLTNFRYNEQAIPADPRIPFVATMQQAAADRLHSQIAGPPPASVVNISEKGDFGALAEKIVALTPAPGSMVDRRKELDPSNDFGNMQDLFKKNDIDVLLVVEINAFGQKKPLSAVMGELAAGIALKAVTGAFLTGSGPVTIGKILGIDPNGRVIFSDYRTFAGGLLASRGDIALSAKGISEDMVSLYVKNVVAP
jgi:hypothetical protein